MNTDYILKADVLDIIFDKRNKSYGAYTLRKFYNNRLYKSISLMVLFIGLLSAFTFLPKNKIPSLPFVNDSTELVRVAEIPKDKPLEPKMKAAAKPLVKAAEVLKAAPSIIFTNKILITKNPLDITKINDLSDSIVISNVVNDKQQGAGKQIVNGGNQNDFIQNGQTDGAPQTDKENPLAYAEVMPAYPGGMEALRYFLQRNLRNPQDLEEGQVISVKVKFVVGYEGNLKSFNIVEDGGKVFNDEVLRVIKKMPKWIPGKSKGENVSVFYTIPVKFTAAP